MARRPVCPDARPLSQAAWIVPLRGTGLLLLSACSGLAFAGAEPPAQEPASPPALAAALPSPVAALESRAPEDPALVPESPSAMTPPPLSAPAARPLPPEDLQRVRRAAQDAVLGRESPPGRYALPYVPGSAPSFARYAQAEGPTEAAWRAEEHDTPPLTERSREGKGLAPPALGRFVNIEPESALERFHGRLARLARGEDDDGKVRVLVYGASHTQADVYTGYLRAYLQGRFGDGGQGFVPLGRVNHWYRTLDTRTQHRALEVLHAARVPELEPEPLGLFGAAFVGRGGDAYGEIHTAKGSQATEFEVHYFEEPGGGSFELQVDGTSVATITTDAKLRGPAYFSFRTTPGEHRIRAKLRGRGSVRLFGIVAETATPGVVVDTLGIGGARMSGSLRWEESTWAGALRRRKPDLVLFAYGTNEASDRGLSLARYESGLRATLARLRRAEPEVSCVFVSPFDLADKNRPRLLRVLDAQRRVSREFGCGFWDGYAFMGGERSMRRWASAKPPLASPDYVHLTRLGYVYAGIALGDALLHAYDAVEGERPATAQVSPEPSASSLAQTSPSGGEVP